MIDRPDTARGETGAVRTMAAWRPSPLLRVALLVLGVGATGLARDVYVSPQGTPRGDGTRAKPLDLGTALSRTAPVKPGDTVWLAGGVYRGPFTKAQTPAGTVQAPIVYRAGPGERATLTAGKDDPYVLGTKSSHTWFWGLEISVGGDAPRGRGCGVTILSGDGVKLINLAVHDNPNRSGVAAFNTGNDQEIYGCLLYRNGRASRRLAHGIYTQNTKEHTTKTVAECLIFDNFGFGVHCYGKAPALANYVFQGVVAFGNGLPKGNEGPTLNFLAGGHKRSDNIVVRECFTYYPEAGRIKRGADFGYISAANGRLVLEGNYFIGGIPSMHVVNYRAATVRRNHIYSPHGYVHLTAPSPEAAAKYDWNENTYYQCGQAKPFSSNTNARHWRYRPTSRLYTLAEWRETFGLDRTSVLVPSKTGRPEKLLVFKRVNKYEPDRVHVVIYNWPRTPAVELDLTDVLEPGQGYRLVDVHDIWARPAVQGVFDGKPVSLGMGGPYAPEFGCYLLLRGAMPRTAP